MLVNTFYQEQVFNDTCFSFGLIGANKKAKMINESVKLYNKRILIQVIAMLCERRKEELYELLFSLQR